MKFLLTNSQYKKLITESKIETLQKLIDKLIVDKYDFVCKIIITPPHHYNAQYSAHFYFKDIYMAGLNPGKYFQMKEDVMNEVWHLVYTFTNETLSIYQKSC